MERIDTKNRIGLFAEMMEQACGLGTWVFSPEKELFKELLRVNSAHKRELELLLRQSGCLDKALAQGVASPCIRLTEDARGLLWLTDSVCDQSGTLREIFVVGPVLNAAQEKGAALPKALRKVPALTAAALYPIAAQLHWAAIGKRMAKGEAALYLQGDSSPEKKAEGGSAASGCTGTHSNMLPGKDGAAGALSFSPPVLACMGYVQTHLNAPFALQALAEATGYTAYYLTKKFQKETGSKLSAYIRDARLAQAKHQLETSNESIRAISEKFCFGTPSFFSTAFSKKYGFSPAQCRRVPTNAAAVPSSALEEKPKKSRATVEEEVPIHLLD